MNITNKKILFAVLDWGIGHATRSSVLIRMLISCNEVVIASDSNALKVLKSNFPNQDFLELPSYNVKYPTTNMVFNIGIQFPQILHAIKKENRVVESFLIKNEQDIIISDSRFGVYNERVRNIFLSHQLSLQVPFFGKFINKQYQKIINNFNEYWIPDDKRINLSGKLSKIITKKPVFYTGLLSPMKKQENTPTKWDTIAILSGPEPQRSILEQKIIKTLEKTDGNHLVIGGNPSSDKHFKKGNIQYFSYLKSSELEKEINVSKSVICRSGYSTLMDLVSMEKGGLLIPTPGQTEQVYLAKRMKKLGLFDWIGQENY